MNQVLVERLRAANLTGDVLVSIFSHLEMIMVESSSGQAALTLGYIAPTDQFKPGDLIPSVNVVLTQYREPEDDSLSSTE